MNTALALILCVAWLFISVYQELEIIGEKRKGMYERKSKNL